MRKRDLAGVKIDFDLTAERSEVGIAHPVAARMQDRCAVLEALCGTEALTCAYAVGDKVTNQ